MGPAHAMKSASPDARKVKLPHSRLSFPHVPGTEATLSSPPILITHPLSPPNATVISGADTNHSHSKEVKKGVCQRKRKLNRLLRSAHHPADIACAAAPSTSPKLLLRHILPHNDDHVFVSPLVQILRCAQASTRQFPFRRAE